MKIEIPESLANRIQRLLDCDRYEVFKRFIHNAIREKCMAEEKIKPETYISPKERTEIIKRLKKLGYLKNG